MLGYDLQNLRIQLNQQETLQIKEEAQGWTAKFSLGWQLRGIWVGVGAGGPNVAERARVADQLKLERTGWGGGETEATLSICLSPSNKCPGVHK